MEYSSKEKGVLWLLLLPGVLRSYWISHFALVKILIGCNDEEKRNYSFFRKGGKTIFPFELNIQG